MKLATVLLTSLAYISTVAAQAAHIGYPTKGTIVHKGENITVQLIRPNSIMGSWEVGLVWSFQYCEKHNPCPNATQELGEIMSVGQFDPQFHEKPGNPYENFTVTIPDFDFWKPGKGEIIATRFHLIGGGPAPILETNVVDVKLRN